MTKTRKNVYFHLENQLDFAQIRKLSPKSIDNDGKIKQIEWQIAEMQKDPATFGYGVVDVADSLKFANIDSSKLFFTYHELKKHMKKHVRDDSKIAYVLKNIKNDVVLGLDYLDKMSNKPKKSIYVQTNIGLCRIGIEQNSVKQLIINEISTMVEDNEFITYFEKAIKNGNAVYKNKRSDDFLGRFPNTVGSVSNFTSTNIITNNIYVVNNHKNKD